jgi:hypothetical protein
LGDVLAEYIYTGSGALESAFIAAKACGVTLAKARLLALAARPLPYWDANAVLDALAPLLQADDAPEVVSLLAPARWSEQDFYTRVLWIAKIPSQVLTPQIRDALRALAEKHSNLAVREWAIAALGRFTDPEAEGTLRRAEARGSHAAMRILCGRDSDPGAAFFRRFTDANPAVRDAAYALVEGQFFANETVPGGLDPERRAVILTHLLADWPGADTPPDRVRAAVKRLYVLVVDAPLSQAARWTPEAAASVVSHAKQSMRTEGAQQQDYYTLLPALRWAHTAAARKAVEQLAQEAKSAALREAAEKTLQKW